MLTDDFLIRQINLALAALASIIGLKTAGQYLDAQIQIDQTLEELLGLRADLINQLEDSRLLATLTMQGNLDRDRTYLVADLFKEQADVLAAWDPASPRSYWSYLRALNFYLEVVFNGGAIHLPDPAEKIDAVVQALSTYEIPQDLLFALFGYYEQIGKYAKAEQALARLQNTPGLEAEIRREYTEFHQRLLEKTDDELARGGLTRAQVNGNLKI